MIVTFDAALLSGPGASKGDEVEEVEDPPFSLIQGYNAAAATQQ